MNTRDNLMYKYRTANVVEKIIAVNVIIFILVYLVRAIAFLFGFDSGLVVTFFSFPKDLDVLLYKPWSIVTYAFLHAGIWHILSNMLILYFSGTYFLNYFSAKKLLSLYFLGAIVGAVIYMLSYNLFPAFEGLGDSYLMGASAAVMAVLVAIATHIPNMRIRLLILGSIKFWWIAAFFVVIDIVQLPLKNTGGHLAHLGGALTGYIFATQMAKGTNIASPLENFVAWVASLFSKEKKSPLKTVHRRKPTKTASASKEEGHQQKIDAILDKIGKSGYESLTKKEKDFLFNAGKEN